MTLAQRAGQLFIVGLPGDQLSPATASAIASHHFGSVQFITTSTAGVAATVAVTRGVQALASAAATGTARFFIAANQEGGQVQALQGPGFSAIPAAADQGQVPPGVIRRSAVTWGRELRAAGVNLNFAPVMDVVPPGTDSLNQPIGVLRREYGHDPATVAAHGTAFIHGMAQVGVAATAKHFPGLGRVRGNTDFSSAVVDTVTTATDPYLQTFRAAIAAGVPFVMVALATYTRIDPHHLAVFSGIVMRGLLRGRLGFAGVIVSDDMGAAAAVAGIPPGQRAISFLAAGGNMITSKYPGPAIAMERAVLARANADPAFRAAVGAAVMHVLAAKQASGLLPCS
jgi:beta-N-acetylhexosaminidase